MITTTVSGLKIIPDRASHKIGVNEVLRLTIPECEQRSWEFLEFGEHDADCCSDQGCSLSDEGHLDAHLRVWLKFEGFERGVMQFYLVVSGGNGDAPYFREKYQPTLFEASFSARTLKSAERNASKHARMMIKALAHTGVRK